MPIYSGEKDMVALIEVQPPVVYENFDEPLAVLYVEDNLSNMELMRRILSISPNIKLIPAVNGDEAISLATDHHPDVIILDINLPGMDGYEVAEILRNQDQTSNIPLIAVSAAATSHDIERGLAFGFLRYLTKPINIGDLMQALQAARRLNERESADRG
jgi:CheY-like chemotaxis protein